MDVPDAQRERLEAYGVRLVDGPVSQVVSAADGSIGVELGGGEKVRCETIFVAPRPHPQDTLLATLGCAKDPETGLVAVDTQGATDVPGVWAAGNVVNPRAQVVTAAGAGSVAGIAMSAWLLEQELAEAVSRRAVVTEDRPR
jgi:thioredoxin reductase (NADPH)